MVDEYLEFIEKIDSIIANKEYQVEELKEKAEGLSCGSEADRVQTSSVQQKMANIVAKYTDLEHEIERLRAKKDEFIFRIEKLSRVHYELMHDKYIKGMTLTEIQRMRRKSPSWASMTHRRAKAKLEHIIRGGSDGVE